MVLFVVQQCLYGSSYFSKKIKGGLFGIYEVEKLVAFIRRCEISKPIDLGWLLLPEQQKIMFCWEKSKLIQGDYS